MPTLSNRAIYNPALVPAASPCCCPACTGLQCLDRTRFFAGQLLTEADLNNDQSYWLAKSRLHNRYLHGWGVVCGLQIVCGDCPGWVTVKTGYAIDPCGNDIIVCAEQPFNVIKAIQACCTPPKPADCSPLRTPPPNCDDARQEWCITIQHEERPTRPITPLRQPTTQSNSSCGCGSPKGGCGCGGKQTSANGTQSAACCCSTPPAQTASAAPGCEPTRILEGFRLGVCAAPPKSGDQANNNIGSTTGNTFAGSACIRAGEQLILQQPSFAGVDDPNTAYTLACNYLTSIRKYLSASSFTSCKAKDDLYGQSIPKPGQNQDYIAQLQSIVSDMVRSITSMLLDCLCLSLLPTCPPDPCTNCLVLACVTVQNGEIIDICHFGGGRRQVITFPALEYWLGLLGLDKSLTTLGNFLEELCCGGEFTRLFQAGFAKEEAFSTGGFTNPAMFNRILSSTLAQNLGSTIVNAAAPGARTIDMRPFVGKSVEEVSRVLKSQEIQTNVVEASPAWTDSVVAQAPQFAPSAFPAGQPLTVFTRNKLVVGFEPTSPTEAMQSQIADLQQQVNALQQQMGGNARPDASRPKRPGRG